MLLHEVSILSLCFICFDKYLSTWRRDISELERLGYLIKCKQYTISNILQLPLLFKWNGTFIYILNHYDIIISTFPWPILNCTLAFQGLWERPVLVWQLSYWTIMYYWPIIQPLDIAWGKITSGIELSRRGWRRQELNRCQSFSKIFIYNLIEVWLTLPNCKGFRSCSHEIM